MKSPVQQQLLKVLSTIDRPGTFCTSGRLPSTIPGLEVAGIGTIALPLEARQAAAIKKLARQAPYGKGTRTVVDTSVRRVWEIDAGQITFANPEWPDVVKQAVETVQSALGLEKQKLDAHLYKVLLYEKGSFFLAHRDGEKFDRMVATMVIALPSLHEGGELIVRHEGQEEIVDFGPHSGFLTQFAAFYADCEHEIRPVTSGFRLALVYNLTLEKSKRPITAPSSRACVAEAARLLGQWGGQRRKAAAANDGPISPKLAVLLDHQYSQAGLTRDALKGVDRARADVLFAAAREAGYDASLALVTYWETGSAEPSYDYDDYYGYGRRRRRRYDDEEFDDDSDESGDGEHVMEEVIDHSLTVEHFRDADGHPLAYGSIPLDEEELVSRKPLNEGQPDREDFEGYTGNAGMTLDRWYHRAAVVLWPAEWRFDVFCEAGLDAAVGGLEQMVRRWRQSKRDERADLQQSCLKFAGRIIAHWPERKYASGGYGIDTYEDDDGLDDELDEDDDFDFTEEGHDDGGLADASGRQTGRGASKVPSRPLLSLLDELSDASLIASWIRNVLGKDASIHPKKLLGDICERHGWSAFENELQELFERTTNETLERHAQLLADFSLRNDQGAGRGQLCSSLARQLVSAVERWDPQPAKRNWQAKTLDLPALLSPLTQTFLALREPELLERLVSFVLDRPKPFELTTVQVPVLLSLKTWLKRNVKHPVAPLHRWLTAVAAELESRAAQPPQEPSDWRRESATGCRCADCKELTRFLSDPHTVTLRLPLAKDRRQHLHQMIDRKMLDTTHVTERKGRPYTLVCTKTKASYERALKAHHIDLDHLAKTRELLDWHNGLKTAPKRSGRAASKSAGKRT